MRIGMKYGETVLGLDLDDSEIIQVVHPRECAPLAQAGEAVRRALERPTGTPALAAMLSERRPKNLVIVVNDVTRPTPYSVMMPPLMKTIAEAGVKDREVTLLTATGIHDPHTREQDLEVYGQDLASRYKIISHDATDAANLIDKGKLPSGYDFWLNRIVDEADFLITIGVVMPHYFAGFSGGRKSILPGVVGKETVQKNHARMVEIMDELPPIRQNPISLEMIQAARIAGVDFILNVVADDEGRLVEVVAGDLEEAWYRAVDVSESMYVTPIKGLADVAISSACGYPRDINLYQAQKALDHADKATKPGGTVILVAECRSHYGEAVFERFMKAGYSPQEIMSEVKANFVMGGHKAYGFAKVAAEKKVILVSSLTEEETATLFARKAATLDEAVAMARADQGKLARFIVMPEGALTVPAPPAR
ncbi:MAG: nickel-dependent lactate racemase [Spirochaetaceae bacterium]|nr:nickel-dependent lactate racemase [Spirochaetaceae bacterium]